MPGPRNQNTGVKLPRIIKAPKGKVLVIAPHPDDESCGIGGTIALHREQDDAVLVCYLTDGRSGDPDGRHGDGFVALRMAEAREAARILGGLELDFFGFPDNRAVNEKDLRMVCERLDSVGLPAPTLILSTASPGPMHPTSSTCRGPKRPIVTMPTHVPCSTCSWTFGARGAAPMSPECCSTKFGRHFPQTASSISAKRPKRRGWPCSPTRARSPIQIIHTNSWASPPIGPFTCQRLLVMERPFAREEEARRDENRFLRSQLSAGVSWWHGTRGSRPCQDLPSPRR